MADSKTYEMLWDCRFCGSKKLLGLTHRFCPGCGGPQDPSARYFPSDAERVAVEDHEYAGRDLVCPSCKEATSRRGKHCTHCGGPVDGAREVEGRGERVHAEGQAFEGEARQPARRGLAAPAASPPKKRTWLRVVLGILGLGLVLLVVLVAWKEDVALTVKGRSWTREIDVETFGPRQDSAWCDRLPAGARSVTRSQKERSTRRVPDGETCRMRKVDNGDGTYRETRECDPRYREEPVYDAHCSFTVDRWYVAKKARATGEGTTAPTWPEVPVSRAAQTPGAERAGAKRETYAIQLVDPKGKADTCEVPAARYAEMLEGSRWLAERRGLTGGLVCDGLRRAP